MSRPLASAAFAVILACLATAASAGPEGGGAPAARGRGVAPAPSVPAAGHAAGMARTPAEASAPSLVPAPVPGAPRRRPLTPLAAEILRLREQEHADLQRLALELEREARPAERVALQKQVQAVKLASEVAMLRAQLEHARRLGRSGSARQLEASIEALLAPAPPGVPQPRSAGESNDPSAER